MDPIITLVKCITLLYRESQVETVSENSADLIRTAIDKIQVNNVDVGIGTHRNSTAQLKDYVLQMCRHPANHQYELSDVLQTIRLIAGQEENIYQSLAQAIEPPLTPPVLKRTITNLRKAIGDFFREQKIGELLKKSSRDFNFNRSAIGDISLYIRSIITELEVISSKTLAKDPGLIRTMDMSDEESLKDVFNDVHGSSNEELPFKTGFQELDQALQGGPRPGDTVVIGAIQHSYKTGMSLSLFTHIPLYNKPKTKDPSKKPLCYRVSLEDPIRNNAQFMYQLLKYEETGQHVDVKGISIEEMAKYYKKRLSINGYYVMMDEVNPSQWTYQSLINRVIELESQGYQLEVLCVDYLSKLPTTGCTQGAIGDDVLDMLSRVRAFCSAHGILFLTPHQLSSEAKRLLQSVPSDQFLNYIKGGGFFEKTKGLDRIYDIGILVNKCEMPQGDFLHVLIDKHRLPTVVDASVKSFYLPFPKNKMPIPSNYHVEQLKPLRKIPKAFATTGDSSFEI